MNRFTIILIKVCRKIYQKLFYSDVDKHFKPSDSMYDSQETSDRIRELLNSAESCMIARYGSTELCCIANYLSIKKEHHSIFRYIQNKDMEWWWNKSIMEQMAKWSGFFPPTEKKLTQFCELMIEDTKQLDVLGSWVYNERFLNEYIKDVYKTHLQYLEPFWCEHPWTSALKGKKVVVVHPFAKLIVEQYHNKREKLFDNPDILPEFELCTVQAVQSLGGESNDFKDWFEALDWMKKEIDKIDYDICLIGCGAYGFPLAAHVKRQGKKVVHLGGALQLLFGIKGNRWEDPNYGVKEWGIPYGSYSSLMNEHWVRPNESLKPKNAQAVEGACYW